MNNEVITDVSTEFGNLVDCSVEQFREYCEDKDLGYISSLNNYFKTTYHRFTKMKDDLIADIRDKEPDVSPEESQRYAVVQGIYAELFKLEEKSVLCSDILKSRMSNSNE